MSELINYEKLRLSHREIDSKTGRIILPDDEGPATPSRSGRLSPAPAAASPVIRARPRMLPAAAPDPGAPATPAAPASPLLPAMPPPALSLYAWLGLALVLVAGLAFLYIQQLRFQNEIKSQLLLAVNEWNASGLRNTQERGRLLARLEAMERDLQGLRRDELPSLREALARQQADLASVRARLDEIRSTFESSVVEVIDDPANPLPGDPSLPRTVASP